MRTLEIILLIALGLLPLRFLLPRLRHWPALLLIPALVMPLHWALEGYRWQMVPAYVLAVILFLVGAYRLWRRGEPAGRPPAWWRTVLKTAGGALLLIMAAAPPMLLPVPDLPDPNGPYAVGTVVIPLVDESRPEIYTADPDDHRRLVLQLWYPAEPDTGEPAPYIDQIELAAPVLAANFDLPSFFLDHIRLARPHARTDADLAAVPETWPMVLFSHGLTGYRAQNIYQVEMLASHGYLVAAVDHTYAAGFTVLPGDEVVVYDPARIFPSGSTNAPEAVPLLAQWAADLGFVVDTLERLNEGDGRFTGRFEIAHVGAIGHSTGGGAVVRFCQMDLRCAAGVGLDAWLLPLPDEIVAEPPTQPFFFLSTPQWLGPENRARGSAMATDMTASYWATIAQTGHYDFTDLSLLSPLTSYLGLTGDLDGEYTLRMINDTTLLFLEEALAKGDAPRLPPAIDAFPEMELEQQPE